MHPTAHVEKLSILITYNGIEKAFESASTASLNSLREQAIAAFQIRDNQHLLSLFDSDGTELGDNVTLSEASIVRCARLLLRPSQVRGGFQV